MSAISWLAGDPTIFSSDDDAITLNRVCAKMDPASTGPPARKIVITASGYAYDRPDGVAVVPLTAMTT